jgi:hypothetical protein
MIGETTPTPPPADVPDAAAVTVAKPVVAEATGKEFGGRDGPEPTRYGDWEKNGRCIDF